MGHYLLVLWRSRYGRSLAPTEELILDGNPFTDIRQELGVWKQSSSIWPRWPRGYRYHRNYTYLCCYIVIITTGCSHCSYCYRDYCDYSLNVTILRSQVPKAIIDMAFEPSTLTNKVSGHSGWPNTGYRDDCDKENILDLESDCGDSETPSRKS